MGRRERRVCVFLFRWRGRRCQPEALPPPLVLFVEIGGSEGPDGSGAVLGVEQEERGEQLLQLLVLLSIKPFFPGVCVGLRLRL